jgi:hypothetical protein
MTRSSTPIAAYSASGASARSVAKRRAVSGSADGAASIDGLLPRVEISRMRIVGMGDAPDREMPQAAS